MIEQSILSGLISRIDYSSKVLPFIKTDYFAEEPQRVVFEMANKFIEKYKVLPTKEALFVELSETKMSEVLHDGVKNLISSIEPSEVNLDWLLDTTEKWCQERAINNGIMAAFDILDGRDKKRDKHAIPKLLQDALGVVFDTRVGHDYFRDAAEQWEYYHDVKNKIPFSIDILNKITKGGVTRKTLNIVMAGINVGKTTFMINLAEAYMAAGLNVLYITLEVAENVIRERTDVCAFDITFDEVRALEKTQYLNRVNVIRNKTAGELVIREFAPGSIHVGHIRHIVNELKMKRGLTPDVIIVDYLTLMLSSLMHPSAKSDSNTYFTSVAEELRGLMKELECVGWTATQFNRGGQDKDDVGLGDTGLSIGIQATSDFSIAFMSPEELAKVGKAVGKVLKNRYANKQTISKFIIGLNNDKQAFFDVDESEQSQVMDQDEINAMKSTKTQSIPKGTTKSKEVFAKTTSTNPFEGFNFSDSAS